MIKYNNSNIDDWNFGDDNIIKVYRNGAVCYYKVTSGDTPTPVQEPCFAVVDDISQYSDTEFEDVFNKADNKWYKLNNLNQYEAYGVYGSGRNITYYEGKLTIDDGYEYQYSGGSWVNVGEVSGSTKTSGFTIQDIGEKINTAITDGDYCVVSYYNHDFPTVPQYMMSYKNQNGHNYLNNFSGNTGSDNITQDTIIDAAVWTFESVPNSGDTWYIKNIKTNEYFGYQSRSSTQSLYLVSDSSKIGVRVVNTYQNAAGFVETASNVSGNINGYGYAINQLNTYTYSLNWWNKGSSESQYWGSDGNASFTIYKVSTGGEPEYPVYYDEKTAPPDNVSFSSMTEAEAYECPWWGMTGIIDNTDYLFCDNNEWLTKYVYQEVSGDYICYEGDKYKKMQEYDRNVDGTVSATTNYVIGDLIESGSTDCQASYDTMYFTMETDDGQPGTFTLKKGTSKSISYSTDDGATWSTTTSTNQTVTASKVMLKSSDTTAWYSSGDNSGMTCTSDFHVYGNIMSLCYGDNFQDKLDIPANNQFRSLFGWSNITDATNLVMNATGATDGCYHSMFRNCYKLVSLPDIKIVATYGNSVGVIIDYCTSLTGFSMSNVTAFTGSYEAYDLGYNCTNLKEVNLPSLVSFRTTGDWFSNCTNLEKIVCGATSNTNWNNYGSGSVGTVFYKNPNATWTGIPSSWIVRDMT